MLPSTSNRSNTKGVRFFEEFGMIREEISVEEEDCLYDGDGDEYNYIKKFSYKPDDSEDNIGYSPLLREKYYKYPGLELLNSLNIEINDSFAKIHICPFHINTSGKVPILQYFVQKHQKNEDSLNSENYTFMSFLNNTMINPVLKAQNILNISFYCFKKIAFSVYSGFIQQENNYYLFFDCSGYDINVHNLYRNNEFWLLTIDELVNSREVCGNFLVDTNTTQFFQENPEFVYLQNELGENYEIPVVAYVGTVSSRSNFISIFGEGQSDPKSIFGPHYYFYDYNDSVKMAFQKCGTLKKDNKPTTIMNWLNNEPIQENIAVIRIALFLGKTKIVENSIKDSSKTSLDMLKEDYTCSTKNHRELMNTLFIADREGKWTENYDSLFLGKGIDIEDEFNKNTYVVKEYEQQMVLSCHFLDSENYSENDRYYIK